MEMQTHRVGSWNKTLLFSSQFNYRSKSYHSDSKEGNIEIWWRCATVIISAWHHPHWPLMDMQSFYCLRGIEIVSIQTRASQVSSSRRVSGYKDLNLCSCSMNLGSWIMQYLDHLYRSFLILILSKSYGSFIFRPVVNHLSDRLYCEVLQNKSHIFSEFDLQN